MNGEPQHNVCVLKVLPALATRCSLGQNMPRDAATVIWPHHIMSLGKDSGTQRPGCPQVIVCKYLSQEVNMVGSSRMGRIYVSKASNGVHKI